MSARASTHARTHAHRQTHTRTHAHIHSLTQAATFAHKLKYSKRAKCWLIPNKYNYYNEEWGKPKYSKRVKCWLIPDKYNYYNEEWGKPNYSKRVKCWLIPNKYITISNDTRSLTTRVIICNHTRQITVIGKPDFDRNRISFFPFVLLYIHRNHTAS